MWLQASAEVPGTLTPPGTGTFTTLHFVVIGLLALLALLIIAVGMRKARARRNVERRVERDATAAGVPPQPTAPDPEMLRDAPLDAHALDRSAMDAARPVPVHDDFVRPEPVAPNPAMIDSVRDAPVSAEPVVPDPIATDPLVDEAPPARAIEDEPIAAAAPLEASPATIADPGPPPAQATPSPADGPATQLKGLGPKVAARLAELGITTVGQIAALDADQAQELDGRLGPFAGRLHRDRWIEQARFLAAGDRAGFEAVFGKL